MNIEGLYNSMLCPICRYELKEDHVKALRDGMYTSIMLKGHVNPISVDDFICKDCHDKRGIKE